MQLILAHSRLLVLASQSNHRHSSLTLTAPMPQLSPGEQAISDLLHCLLHTRNKPGTGGRSNPTSPASKARAPSFLSGGLPRDRRGRIAQKNLSISLSNNLGELSNGESGDEASVLPPPNSNSGKNWTEMAIDAEREKDREFLEALKSPDVGPDLADSSAPTRASVGGWGLGVGKEESSGKAEIDDDEEALSWDQAQVPEIQSVSSEWFG